MAKKVIQVPVDEKLLQELDNVSKRQHKARAELIRQACQHYLQQVEREELDKTSHCCLSCRNWFDAGFRSIDVDNCPMKD